MIQFWWVRLAVGFSMIMLPLMTSARSAEAPDPSSLRPRCIAAAAEEPLPSRSELVDALAASTAGTERCEALDALEALAAQDGDVEAALHVGDVFTAGVLVDRDLGRGEAAYLLAFDLGSAEAALKLGDMKRAAGNASSAAAATAYYEDARSRGAAEAALRLGDFFVTANDGARATANYSEAAAAGLADGHLKLAKLLEEGRLVPRDVGSARSHLLQAADAGSQSAVVALALLQLDSGDAGGAVAALKAAAGINPDAALTLGDLYRDGQIGVPDLDEAIASYQLAADAGSAAAWLRIGDLQRDRGNELAAAVHAYQEALAQGDADAGLRLGDLYAAHPATAPDSAAALDNYVAAFALGSTEAAARIGQLLVEQDDIAGAARYYLYSPDEVPLAKALPVADAMAAQKEADRQGQAIVGLYQRAYQAGQYDAAVRLGDIYFEGKLVARDIAAAERFYQLAGSTVPALTLLKLGDARLDGIGVAVDRRAALEYYRRALGGGVAVAGLKLGTALSSDPQAADEAAAAFVRAAELGEARGYLLAGELQQARQPAAAAALYEKALSAGIGEAAGHLGDMYFDGVLGTPDMLRAASYYERASSGIPSRALLPIADALASQGGATLLSQAVELYERSLAQGNRDAAGRLGALYLSQALGPSDPAKAEQYFDQQPDGIPAETLVALGNAYRDGNNVQVSGSRAAQYYQRAVAAGDVAANQLLGDLYFDGKLLPADPVQATRFYEAAGAVPLRALLAAGDVYRDGAAGTPDGHKALAYYAMADEAGVSEAAARMAELYFAGSVVPRDIGKAAALYERSPEGVPERALLEIADYFQGQAGDEAKARKYYEAALQHGQTEAAARLGDIFFYGRGTSRDLAKAESYYERAPSGVPDEANLILGDAYRDGNGVSTDGERALHYYQAALPSYPEEAAERLANILFLGKIVPRDLMGAAGYFDRWTRLPPPAVLAELGDAFVTGRGVAADVKRGLGYLSRAADAGDVASLVRLGELFRSGEVVPQDLPRAAGYLLRAATAGNERPLLALADDYLDQPVAANELNPGIALLRQAASANVPGAAVLLAEALVAGRGILPDGAAAAAVLELAVGRGNADAGLALVKLYRRGAAGLPAQPAEARRVYDAVAAHLPAQQAIAERLMLSVGVSGLPRSPEDLARDFMLLQPATQAQVLLEMRTLNENAYVFLLQSALVNRGLLIDEAPSGQLTRKTIRAIRTLCAGVGQEETCLAGPMSEASSQVITDALRHPPSP
ncbi:tetratricopeptide repeat protein [Devosia sp. A16]|uniref:tetratricopeptide repeat protein n=1 Tax=Devosia sp. A16 TaxID=1736675 RepID=UPI0006D7BF75|nr:SEL1-like repeat protein [Devosia sp. A16]